jgi:cytochrome c5
MGMKTAIFRPLTAVLALLVFIVPACRDGEKTEEPAVSVQALFENRCTPCHGWEDATSIHGSEETVLQLIKRMKNKGARMSDAEAMDIASFLSSPSRHVFEARCTKCHGMDTLLSAHGKGKMTVETVQKMRKKKGADISAEDEKTIQEFVIRYYSTKPD